MLSLKNKFLFIHVPKTGGNSIQNILKEYSEDRIVTIGKHQDGIERFEVRNDKYPITKHSTLSEYKRFLDKNVYDAMFKFATIRNPWDMMISFYFSPHLNLKKWNKRKFCKLLKNVQPLRFYITTLSNQDLIENIDYLIRFENLENDFRKVCQKISIPFEKLKIRNQSKRYHYSFYYDDEMVELVKNKFSEEIQYGKYAFENI